MNAATSGAIVVREADGPFGRLDRLLLFQAATVGVGLGYVGLPLAHLFTARGDPVLVLDADPAKAVKSHRDESAIC
ncbi:MAG TPA: hypothetical protein VHR66_11030 [Gemmataceae bacterium]|nr:hypothetical protein [Gemmataceae bacterium]